MVDTAKELGCDTVINCTGLASRNLCEDSDLLAGRGVINLYDRGTCARLSAGEHDVAILTEEEPWGNENEPAYIIPRGNKLVVGGGYRPGDAEVVIRPEEQDRLVRNA